MSNYYVTLDRGQTYHFYDIASAMVHTIKIFELFDNPSNVSFKDAHGFTCVIDNQYFQQKKVFINHGIRAIELEMIPNAYVFIEHDMGIGTDWTRVAKLKTPVTGKQATMNINGMQIKVSGISIHHYGASPEKIEGILGLNCQHQWIDTGFALTFCKYCNVSGRMNNGIVTLENKQESTQGYGVITDEMDDMG